MIGFKIVFIFWRLVSLISASKLCISIILFIFLKDVEAINQKITSQGNKIRQLKTDKAAKDVLANEVQLLLELKKEFKAVTGSEWKPQETVATKPANNSVAKNISNNETEVAEVAAELVAQGKKVPIPLCCFAFKVPHNNFSL